MFNSYAYNRKTLEEDQAILAAVKRHHKLVANKGYLVVMTVLVGSQNYDLDDKNSDIDTYSFIFPPLVDIAYGKELYSSQFEVEDGICNVKDIRLALNLLRKTSPNSVEYFTSKYKVYNPIFADLLQDYLDNNNKLWHMIHCNYSHMLYAIAGMAHQLTKRNMPAGKRFGHALRLDNMYYHFMNSMNANAVIELRPGGDREIALNAKRDENKLHTENYNNQCERIAAQLDSVRDEFKLNDEQVRMEQMGLALIDSLQWKLFKRYLEENK